MTEPTKRPKTRVAINGFGRIGRCILRALQERPANDLQIVAINELASAPAIAYLTRYDSTHGRFRGTVELNGETLIINGQPIALTHIASPAQLPWAEQQIDLVLECTGVFAGRLQYQQHLTAGAKHVLLSQPTPVEDVDATIVFGINHRELDAKMKIVSNASCTTNAITPVIAAVHEAFGIESGVIRTLHSAMNDQPVMDAYHPTDLRKARAASASFIPVETELARGIERIFPELVNRFEAQAIRLPVTDVSAIDLAVYLSTDVDAGQVNAVLRHATATRFQGVLGMTDELLASCDFIHDPHSGVVDSSQTRVAGKRLVKILTWFDNEWGYANRMLDVASSWSRYF